VGQDELNNTYAVMDTYMAFEWIPRGHDMKAEPTKGYRSLQSDSKAVGIVL